MLISPSIPTLNLTLTLNDRSDFYSYTIQNIVIFQDFKINCWPLYIGFSQKNIVVFVDHCCPLDSKLFAKEHIWFV